MKFKVDENLPDEVADDLRTAGFDAQTVADQALAGATDDVLLSIVQREQRVLLTMDKGIANIHEYPPKDYAGIVLFRPRSAGRRSVLQFVRQYMPPLLKLELTGHLLVVSEAGIRIR